MVEMYCALIMAKRRSFDRVPDSFKDAVQERLKKLGYDTDGNKLPNEE